MDIEIGSYTATRANGWGYDRNDWIVFGTAGTRIRELNGTREQVEAQLRKYIETGSW